MQRAFATKSRTIRLPAEKFRLLSKAKAKSTELEQQHGRLPEEAELADALQVSLNQLRGVLRHWHGVTSLETPVQMAALAGDSRADTLLDTHSARPLAGPRKDVVQEVEIELVRQVLADSLDELAPLEATVLRLRFGLDDGAPLTWGQISAQCDMPVRELQTIQARAFRRLRKARGLIQLQDFCHHAEWEWSPID